MKIYVCLLYIPGEVFIISNIRYWRFSTHPDLTNRLAVSKERPDVIGVGVGDFVMLISRPLEEL